MSQGYQALTEKEKQTLRLVLEGHGAKAMASQLGLSVHTVNERLRFARRKLGAGSSREAAQLLRAQEAEAHKLLVDERMGEAEAAATMKDQRGRTIALAIGVMVIMSLFLTTLLLSAAQPAANMPAQTAQIARTAQPARAATASAQSGIVQTALHWLALVDAGEWTESWDATGAAFKQLNSSEKWASVSQEVRPPLGAVQSRVATSEESVPAPPYGYQMVKFRTSFANRADVTETLTLVREGGGWRVVGYLIG